MAFNFDDFKWDGPTISYSKMSTVLQCPGKYKLERIDKIKVPKSDALLRGAVFDNLCAGSPLTSEMLAELIEIERRVRDDELTEDPLPTIIERYEEYKGLMPEGRLQFPFQTSLGHKNKKGEYTVIGYIDLIPNNVEMPIIEIKYSKEPWPDGKYSQAQAALYAWVMGQDRVTFHIMNHARKGLQDKTLDIKASHIREIQEKLIQAAKIIDGGEFPFTPNKLCESGYCDYMEYCPTMGR